MLPYPGFRAGSNVDENLDALLGVARETAGNVGYVNAETWAKASSHGWSEEELTELFAHVSANMYTNYFNHYAHTELDVPAAPAL